MASLCMQVVVNDPSASDAIAKSVSTSKNRYINTHTYEMSRFTARVFMSHHMHTLTHTTNVQLQ